MAQGSGSGLYDGITRFAVELPWLPRELGALYTEVGLLGFVALFAVVWWRARGTTTEQLTAALLAPVGMVVAYVLSEVFKTFIHEERPCRNLAEAATVLKCPPVGDWSFPSNHSTIAASAAVGLLIAWRKLMPWMIAMALLMAFSRVFVGAHYPHDVATGLALGAVVAWLVARWGTAPAAKLVARLQQYPRLALLLGTPPEEPAELVPAGAPLAASEEVTQVIPRRRPAPLAEQPTVRLPVQPPRPPRRPPPGARRPQPPYPPPPRRPPGH